MEVIGRLTLGSLAHNRTKSLKQYIPPLTQESFVRIHFATRILPNHKAILDICTALRTGMDYLWVGLGGMIGANARFILGRAIADRAGSSFPYGTITINITGSLLIGIIMTLLTERLVADPAWRLVLVVGFLGGYTTFSSYTFEAIRLFQQGQAVRGLTYIFGSNILGLLACYVGIVIARELAR
jgi:CrcB protein